MAKKGIALILVLIVIIVLTVLGSAIVMRSVSENSRTKIYSNSTNAFWAAEAGINYALNALKTSYITTGNGVWIGTLSGSRYSVDVSDITIGSQTYKRVISHGYVPVTGQAVATRTVEATMLSNIPANLFGNAIYCAEEVELTGNSFQITGNVRYGGEITGRTDRVAGTVTNDPSINPLARLDFQQLLTISEGQHNVYVKSGNKLVNQYTNSQSFPSSFWYDQANNIPNVVYVKSDLTLNGNIGTVGGFFVVVGNVITDPSATQDATINGTGQIDGVIYTRGEFEINGGGSGLNVNGGVFSGESADIKGNATVTYNTTYMSAVQGLALQAVVQIMSWRDTQNPYNIN